MDILLDGKLNLEGLFAPIELNDEKSWHQISHRHRKTSARLQTSIKPAKSAGPDLPYSSKGLEDASILKLSVNSEK
jgi:hypothetical protein